MLPAASSTVPRLPDDVFLAVVSATDIDTFLAMRLLDHRTQLLINDYAISISETVARNTFPLQNHIFEELPAPTTAGESICWLRELRYLQLASIVLEWTQFPVAAEDPSGDGYRAQLARG